MLHLCVNMSAKPSIVKQHKLSAHSEAAIYKLHKRYAFFVAMHAETIYNAVKSLRKIDAEIQREAIMITGGVDYDTLSAQHLRISFDQYGSIGEQMKKYGKVVDGPGFFDIMQKAFCIKEYAQNIAPAPAGCSY